MNCPAKLTKRLISLVVLFLAILYFYPSLSYAQTSGGSAGASGVSLAYSPPIIELTLDPGESYTNIIKLENRGTTTQTFYPGIFDFLPTGENGGQEFISAEDSDPTFSLSKWIIFPKEPLTLRPKEADARQFTISVPKNALPGGKYAALFFDSKPPTAKGLTGAKLRTRTGPILLVTVTGQTKENLKSVEFKSDKGFYESPPVNFVSRVQNGGTVHVKPIGQVTIKNMFGKVVGNIPVNATLSNVLPNSTRKYDLSWKPGSKFLIGKYQAVLNLTYGSKVKQNVIDVTNFWVIPWKIIVIALVSLAVLYLLIRLLFKKYNNWVLSRVPKNGGDGSNTEGSKDPTPVTSSIASEPEQTTTTTIAGTPSLEEEKKDADKIDSIAQEGSDKPLGN